MWCVVYTGDDREEKTEDFIKAVLPASTYTRCFHLMQHKAQKSQGTLRDVVRKYLPGYVFIETEKPGTVRDILKNTPKKLLFCDNWSISALNREEEALFRTIVDENGEIGLSTARTSVDAENGKKKNEYISGPLVKVADQVVYVNFHRRFAVINGDFIGGKEPLRLGFRFDGEEISLQNMASQTEHV